MKRFSSPSDINTAVVGYGGAFNMGRAHLNEMRKAGMTPLAVAEPDPERRAVAEAEFPGIETYESVEALLKQSKTNLIAIITPHNTHAPLALKCLEAGVHTVCEKPFAITTAECDAMIAAAEKNRVMVSTYHNRHWDGCILKAVEVIESGVLGEIVRVDARMGRWSPPKPWWRDSKSISGGILYDWGVHLLEYMFQAMGAGMSEVSGYLKSGYWAEQSSWGKDTIEDEGFVMIRFKTGQWASLRITRIGANDSSYWVTITGTKGTHSFDGGRFRTAVYGTVSTVVNEGDNPASQGWQYYQNVCDHLCAGEPLVITPEWARRPIHVIDLAEQSSKAGKALAPRYA